MGEPPGGGTVAWGGGGDILGGGVESCPPLMGAVCPLPGRILDRLHHHDTVSAR